MKPVFKFSLAVSLLLGAYSTYADSGIEALFSPRQGEEAFAKTFDLIRNANNSVYITLYSWSDYDLDNAIKDALQRNVDVKVVLNPSLAQKSSLQGRILELENLGAQFKKAKQNMHEKFTLIDNKTLVNGSANMSSGAKTSYSENFIFHYSDVNANLSDLIRDFKHEFAILWNSSTDLITHGEEIAPSLDYEFFDGNKIINTPRDFEPTLYSSSQNFTVKQNKETSSNYETGRYITLSRRGGTKNQTWFVKDAILNEINKAKSQILVGLNHFNIREISDALIEAVKRGVDVRLAVDNQEFKSSPNDKEMTPQFVEDWKALDGNKIKSPPVRVKFYSHSPSPRYWLLNHHKFILIDYEKNGNDTVLISGSYNVSKNAEHQQFDNMVIYKGDDYKTLFTGFREEFKYLWDLNREVKGKIISNMITPQDGTNTYKLHSKEAVSLSWEEMLDIKNTMNKNAKEMFKELYQHRDCQYYNADKKRFEVYNYKTKTYSICN